MPVCTQSALPYWRPYDGERYRSNVGPFLHLGYYMSTESGAPLSMRSFVYTVQLITQHLSRVLQHSMRLYRPVQSAFVFQLDKKKLQTPRTTVVRVSFAGNLEKSFTARLFPALAPRFSHAEWYSIIFADQTDISFSFSLRRAQAELIQSIRCACSRLRARDRFYPAQS